MTASEKLNSITSKIKGLFSHFATSFIIEPASVMPGGFDKGYLIQQGEECPYEDMIEKVPPERRVVFHIHGQKICYDCIDLYIWLRINPSAKLVGPFGNYPLTTNEKEKIINITEGVIPKKDWLPQRRNYYSQEACDIPASILRYLTNQKTTDDEPLEFSDNELFDTMYQYITTHRYDEQPSNLMESEISGHIDVLIRQDRNEVAERLINILIGLDIHFKRVDCIAILKGCLIHGACALLDVFICQGGWCKLSKSNDTTNLLKFCIQNSEEYVFYHFLDILEECNLLIHSKFNINGMYIQLAKQKKPTKWAVHFYRHTKCPPSEVVLKYLDTDAMELSDLKWWTTIFIYKDLDALENATMLLLQRKEFELVLLLLDMRCIDYSSEFINNIIESVSD